MQCNMIGETVTYCSVLLLISEHKQKDRVAAVSPKSVQMFDQAAAGAKASFRFLRQPNRPNAPRPPAKRGSAVGSGVAVTPLLTTLISSTYHSLGLVAPAIDKVSDPVPVNVKL
jgi:hypothetical protein